MMIRVTKPF